MNASRRSNSSSFWGFPGQPQLEPLQRIKTTMETPLNKSKASAYSFHSISWFSSTPVSRVQNPLDRPHHRISQVRSRLNTRAHKRAQRLSNQEDSQEESENLQPSIRCHQNFSGRNMAYTRYTSSLHKLISMMIGSAFIKCLNAPSRKTRHRQARS